MSHYLIIGDCHCRPDNIDKIKRLMQMVESNGFTTIWLGDLLDTKDIVRAQCLNTYIEYFRSSRLQHIILVGNHDWTNANCEQHSLEALKSLPNVVIVDKPHFEGKSLFLPYYHDKKVFIEAIEPFNLAAYLFMHNGVNGMDYGNGFIAENDLDIEMISKFDRVIGGHFHKYQENKNLVYLGTPFSHNFGESNQDKFVAVFDDSNGSLELIKTDFPKHVTTEYNLDNDFILYVNDKDYNRVILRGTQEQINSFDKSLYSGVKFIEEIVQNDGSSVIKETETPETMFTKWYRDIKKQDNEELYQLGLKILNVRQD